MGRKAIIRLLLGLGRSLFTLTSRRCQPSFKPGSPASFLLKGKPLHGRAILSKGVLVPGPKRTTPFLPIFYG